jgi:thioesterase domain-containing protein
VYKKLSDELGKEHPLWGLQARGFDDDEKPYDQTIAQAARDYIKAIKNVQLNGPYYLLGHSMGGTIAQEAAVQLEALGEKVANVFLLDSTVSSLQPEANSKPENDKMFELLKAQLIGMTDEEVPTEYDALFDLVQTKLEEQGVIPINTPKAYGTSAIKTILRSSELTKNHTPSRCRTEIIYFRATKDSAGVTPDDNLFNWQPYSEKPVRIHEVPVTHNQMLRQPDSYKLIARVVHEAMLTNAGQASQ